MNLVIKILAEVGLVRKDLDYHVVRAAMVMIYFFFAYKKCFPYGAADIDSVYQERAADILDVSSSRPARCQLVFRRFRMGVWGAYFLGFWNKALGVLGALGSGVTFIMTITIIPFMPDGWNASAGGFAAMQGNVAFPMKDLVLFAVGFYLLKQDA